MQLISGDPITIAEALVATSVQGSRFMDAIANMTNANANEAIIASNIGEFEHCAVGFEIRLDDDNTVDLGVLITPESGRQGLAELGDSPMTALAERSPEWRRLSRLCARWADPGDPAHHRIRRIFLEFDSPDCTENQTPVPSVFLSVSSEFGWEVVDHTTTTDWILEEALPILAGGALPDALAVDARRCLDTLPEDGRLLHVAVMMGRTPPGLRLFVSVPAGEVAGTLERCDWPGDPREIDELQLAYGAELDFIQLQLDLFDGVSERIGIEFSPTPAGWPKLLDWLVRDGLCLDQKRTALFDWPGVILEPLTPGGWPCTFIRELSHVKLVYEPGQPVRAKAYVTVTSGYQLDLGAIDFPAV